MKSRRFQNVDVLLEVINDDEILYFLNNIASRLMVPHWNAHRGLTEQDEVITVTQNGKLFQINTESFCDHISQDEAA